MTKQQWRHHVLNSCHSNSYTKKKKQNTVGTGERKRSKISYAWLFILIDWYLISGNEYFGYIEERTEITNNESCRKKLWHWYGSLESSLHYTNSLIWNSIFNSSSSLEHQFTGKHVTPLTLEHQFTVDMSLHSHILNWPGTNQFLVLFFNNTWFVF